jgi:two-component system, NtrC family, sensor kinase
MRITNTNDQQLLTLLHTDKISTETTKLWLRTRNQVIFSCYISRKKIEQLDQIQKRDLPDFLWVILVAMSCASLIRFRQLSRPGMTIPSLSLIVTVLVCWLSAVITKKQLSQGLDELTLEAAAKIASSNFDIDLIARKSFEDSVVVPNTLQPWQWYGRVMVVGKSKWLQGTSRTKLQVKVDILGDGVLMDIIECKQIDATLFESEEQLSSIFEQISVAIAQVGLNGQFLQVNSKLCEITGYSREELLTKTIFNLSHPDDWAVNRCYLRLVNSKKLIPKLEKRYICQNGVVIWVNIKVSVVRDAQGNPKYYIGQIEDVTKRKQAEAALRCSQEQLRALTETASEIIAILDTKGSINYVSSAFRQLLGCEPTDLVSLDFFKLIHIEDNLKVTQFLTEMVLEPRGGLLVEFRLCHQNGDWQTLKAIGQSLLDETGEIKIIVNSSDITERKQSQAVFMEQFHLSNLAAEVGVAIANGGTLANTLQCCAEAIRSQLNATSTTIWTLNPLTQQVTAGQILPLNSDLINLVTESCQPQSLIQHQSQPNHLSGYPLIVEDRVIGVLEVLSDRSLSEEASHTLSWAANAIAKRAVALNRHNSHSELLNRREAAVFEVSSQIRNSLELDTILETAVQSIARVLQLDHCSFLWYGTQTTIPEWSVVHEAKNGLLASHLGRYKTAQMGQFAQELLNQQIIQIDRVEALTDATSRQFLGELGYASILAIPLETEAGKTGVVMCGCTTERLWDDCEVELLQKVIAQLRSAINQAELYQQAKLTAQLAQAQTQQLELALHQLQSTQARLVQSEKMSSLGQLVAGIAHEINNPVNFIHGNLAYASAYFYDILSLLHLYQEHYPKPAAAIVEQSEVINLKFIAKDLPKLLSSMQRGTDRIRSIVLSLRHFSRLDEADMKQADLHEGIESTLSILQHRLNSKGQLPEILVKREYGDLPNVQCYPGQLNQVFMNILSNAIEAFHQPGVVNKAHGSLIYQKTPAITISTSILDGSESNPSLGGLYIHQSMKTQNVASVLIKISDNGPGMTELVRTRLFDPFFTTKPVGQGIGLGLSISYQIVVEHHLGVLTCASKPGEGTEFWIEIPIQQLN